MTPDAVSIVSYRPGYEAAVIALWEECGLTRPWNNPRRDIARKMHVNPELFLVGVIEGRIVATVMGGYEGHRAWVNYLAVALDYQRQGIGRRMMKELEELLHVTTGCPKINLQVRSDNEAALRFYEKLGYIIDPVISMGKRLVDDN